MVARLRGVDGYILDLDGTVYLSGRLVTGADAAIAELRRRGRRIVFLSNKPLETASSYADKLSRMGVPTREAEVVHSSSVLARHMAQVAAGANVFAIGEPPLQHELERAGLRLTEDPAEIEYVVAAFDRTFDYRKLDIAFQALRRGARFWATNPDRTCPVDGGELPDAAAVIAALEATTGRKVEEIAGKPSPLMLQAALSALGLPASSCVLVGDRLETDIRMAQEGGLISVLTLTGVTRRAEVRQAEYRPHHVIESLAELPELDGSLARRAEGIDG